MTGTYTISPACLSLMIMEIPPLHDWSVNNTKESKDRNNDKFIADGNIFKNILAKKLSGIITTSIYQTFFVGIIDDFSLKNKLFNEIEENQFSLNYYIDLSIRSNGKKMLIKWAEMKLCYAWLSVIWFYYISKLLSHW